MTQRSSEEVKPNITSFFEKYPNAGRLYSAKPLYHLTLGSNVPGILEYGLQPRAQLFPEEHGRFLLNICEQYASNDPNNRAYVQDRILEPGTVYLSAREPDMARPDYGVPERLMLLMRSLQALREKQTLTPDERAYAGNAFGIHLELLTREDQTISALQISPMAPSVVNGRFGRIDLSRVQDPEMAELAMEYLDGSYENNIGISEPIDPNFIREHAHTSLTEDYATRGIYTEPGWTSHIQ